MKTYSVYLPPDDANKPQTASDISYAKFLVDGKCIAAVFLPPLWLIWNRLWWGFAVYLAFSAIISLLAFTDYREAIVFLSMIPGLFLLLEGHELIRQYWEDKGWRFVGVVHGRNAEEAELRYFEANENQANERGSDIVRKPESIAIETKPAPIPSIGLFATEN